MRLLESFIDLIAPLHCIYCDSEGSVLCESCAGAELINMPSCCFYCCRITENFNTCTNCLKKSHLRAVWCVTEYSMLAQNIIKAYKYDSCRGVKKTIVNKMLGVLPSMNLIVTNVPTAQTRIRQRGFDHCALMAKDIARSRGLTYSSLLYRTKPSHQVGSTKAERIKQTKNLFYSINDKCVNNKNILLVDDVATTGATMQSAARALKIAGAREVYGVVFARKI